MNAPILIVGTGALATLFAARLAAAGGDITMLGTWQNGLEALRREGARLVRPDGQVVAHAVRVLDHPGQSGPYRFALVLVKAWQTERAAAQLTDCLSADGLALTLQNGLGNREVLGRHLGGRRVAVGVTTTGATLLGPGLARTGGEGTISLERHPQVAALGEVLRSAGFRVETVEDAGSLLWGKLVINAAINPLTALLKVPNGELLERPAARALMKRLADETAAVARTRGIDLPFLNPARAAEEVARRTAPNHSSMFQDMRRGAPTEIDAICGAVVRAAQEGGSAAPMNWAMWHLVRSAAGNGQNSSA